MTLWVFVQLHFVGNLLYIKDNTSEQQYSFITIKVSNRKHISTNQVVIIRSITESYKIAEGCAHVWDPISVYKWAYW